MLITKCCLKQMTRPSRPFTGCFSLYQSKFCHLLTERCNYNYKLYSVVTFNTHKERESDGKELMIDDGLSI